MTTNLSLVGLHPMCEAAHRAYAMLLGTRHACDQGDGLKSYTWTKYDVREGGVQVIEDDTNNVRLTTEFFKVPGGKHGGSWAARVKGEPLDIGISYRAHHSPA